jgi:tetratricopeptide (TPR) repeat protein
MHTEACEATRVRGEQSEQLLDLRMECLTRRLRELKATTDLFSSADNQVVENAARAAQSLPDLDPCADAASLQATLRPPPDRDTRARVEELRARLATVRALEKAGKYREGVQLGASYAKDADALHYRPVEAEALEVWGTLQFDNRDWRNAEETTRRAITAAEAGGNVEVEIKGWIELVWVLAHEDRLAEAHSASQHAFAIIERVGRHEKEVALLQVNLGYVYWQEHDFDQMLRCCLQALEIRERVLGANDPEVGDALNNLGLAYGDRGEYQTALTYFQRALAVKERAVGSEHPSVASTLINVGENLKKQRRYSEAQPYQERALTIIEASLGESHPVFADNLLNLAEIYEHLGDHGKALRYLERKFTNISATTARRSATLSAHLH